jgi:hypothetical protein
MSSRELIAALADYCCPERSDQLTASAVRSVGGAADPLYATAEKTRPQDAEAHAHFSVFWHLVQLAQADQCPSPDMAVQLALDATRANVEAALRTFV